MIINGKEVNIEDINYESKMHTKRENGLLLSDEQINILKKYDIDYLKYNNMSSLIYEIEEILNIEYYEDLDNLSIELAEFNYYQNTNK
ncbi:MAG: hypothetical protein E7157_00785 [Lactobacillales bacterium]|nr:hypothetical protein [Lactobacillales bacterium]